MTLIKIRLEGADNTDVFKVYRYELGDVWVTLWCDGCVAKFPTNRIIFFMDFGDAPEK